jgi:hypothetical protein
MLARSRFSFGQSRPRRIHMGHSQYDDASRERAAWNAGKKVGTKRPLTQKQIWAVRFFSIARGAFETGCSILQSTASCAAATWSRSGFANWLPVRRSELVRSSFSRRRDDQSSSRSPATLASLLAWLGRRGGTVEDYALPEPDRSRTPHEHEAVRPPRRLVGDRDRSASEEYCTHSLRRTTPLMIYKATGNLRAIQISLGHSKIENTVRYLGVDVEDALPLAERAEI